MATVLAVDDEPDILELIRVNLEMQGHDVVVAGGAEEAFDVLRGRRPDLILLDVMMPGMDGWEILGRLKRDPDLGAATVPVVMLTALASEADRIRGGIEGAVRYVTKPFNLHDLGTEIDGVLAGEPEPSQRKKVQHESLGALARLERGAQMSDAEAHPRLTRLERAPDRVGEPAHLASARERVDELSDKQRELLEVLRSSASVSEAAASLSVSRSNVYASLRRISRRLGTRSVGELLAMVREGDLLTGEPR